VPPIIDNILRAGEGKTLRKLRTLVNQINSIEEDFRALSDAELRAMTGELKQRHGYGQTLHELLPEAFATAREAAHRVLGQRHFDVQLMGGGALHLGNIAEMKTGEGKSLRRCCPPTSTRCPAVACTS
jgi:preprotein translocase subunit SecA